MYTTTSAPGIVLAHMSHERSSVGPPVRWHNFAVTSIISEAMAVSALRSTLSVLLALCWYHGAVDHADSACRVLFMTCSCCCTTASYIAVGGCSTWNASHRISESVLQSNLKCTRIFLLQTLPRGAARRYTSVGDGSSPHVRATTCASTCSVKSLATSSTSARSMVAVAHFATTSRTWRRSPV